jgi:3-deoxy-manno-octulosonate cytidylyltransferase (CMP-KDO synthetase)
MNIFIPVRLNSKRLPGKPLKIINGKPLLFHTYNQVINNLQNINYNNLYVVCEDNEIISFCKESYIPYIDTSINEINFRSGSDRVAWAAKQLNLLDHDLIINVQGDMFTIPLNCFELILLQFIFNFLKSLSLRSTL